MPMNTFETVPQQINNWLIIRLPMTISTDLPSRGMVMAEVTINETITLAPLEPDGMGSHWFRVNEDLFEGVIFHQDSPVSVTIMPTNDWTDPEIPDDLNHSLTAYDVRTRWDSLTSKARWAWVRWIRFTNNPKTREKRIVTLCSMLESGKRRPCCFDHSRCTVTQVSKSGQLDLPPVE